MDQRLKSAVAALTAGEPFVEPIDWGVFTRGDLLGRLLGIDRPWRDLSLERRVATDGRIIVSVPKHPFRDRDETSRPEHWVRQQVEGFPWLSFDDGSRRWIRLRSADWVPQIDYAKLEQLRELELSHFGPHRAIRGSRVRVIDLYLIRFAAAGRGFLARDDSSSGTSR